VTARLRSLAQPIDRRDVGAIFLIMLGGGADVDIAVTPGLLVACTADADHVAMKEGLGARQRCFVDAEGFQKSRHFMTGVRAAADEDIELGGSNAKIVRDAREIAAVNLAKLSHFLSVLEPVAE
jgi:hypothetical protein